jgi:threonine synthase
MIKQVFNRPTSKGIWEYQDFLPYVDKKFKITLGEGNIRISREDNIYFIHEYENPTGSVKDRGICFQMANLLSKGIKTACISSSGNAAISASRYAEVAGIKLTVFLSPKINKYKLNLIKTSGSNIVMTLKPVSEAIKYSKAKGIFNLRQSMDPYATYGFSTLAFELAEKIKNADAVFFPVSSATTLVGTAMGLEKVNQRIALHAVQTEAVCPIGSVFDKEAVKQKESIADAIVAKYTPRQEEAINYIRKSKGAGWVVSDEQILYADNWLKQKNIICSFEGSMALAGLFKAMVKGYNYMNPVCVLTGKRYEK